VRRREGKKILQIDSRLIYNLPYISLILETKGKVAAYVVCKL
jgi:hypothetical protein